MKKSEKTHQLLLATAEKLMTNQKIETVTVDQICRAAGIHRSTFYRHFPSYTDLILSLVHQKLNVPIDTPQTVEETILCILTLIDENFTFFRHLILSLEPLNLNFQTLLVERLATIQPPRTVTIDRSNDAEVEMIYRTAVGLFSGWLLRPQVIHKEDVLAFLEKYFHFFE